MVMQAIARQQKLSAKCGPSSKRVDFPRINQPGVHPKLENVGACSSMWGVALYLMALISFIHTAKAVGRYIKSSPKVELVCRAATCHPPRKFNSLLVTAAISRPVPPHLPPPRHRRFIFIFFLTVRKQLLPQREPRRRSCK